MIDLPFGQSVTNGLQQRECTVNRSVFQGVVVGILALMWAMPHVQAQTFVQGNATNYPNTPYPGVPKAQPLPEHARNLSGRCTSMLDAIRTADVRGLSMNTKQELQQNYRKECAQEESDAYRRAQQDRYGAIKENREAVAQAQLQAKKEAERETIQSQMCLESKRILATKKARTDLSEGEKVDLKRFEDNYLQRCTR